MKIKKGNIIVYNQNNNSNCNIENSLYLVMSVNIQKNVVLLSRLFFYNNNLPKKKKYFYQFKDGDIVIRVNCNGMTVIDLDKDLQKISLYHMQLTNPLKIVQNVFDKKLEIKDKIVSARKSRHSYRKNKKRQIKSMVAAANAGVGGSSSLKPRKGLSDPTYKGHITIVRG